MPVTQARFGQAFATARRNRVSRAALIRCAFAPCLRSSAYTRTPSYCATSVVIAYDSDPLCRRW